MKQMFTAYLRKLRLLPVLIVVASLAFMVRMGDAYVGMKSLSGAAYAEDAAAKESSKEPSKEAPKDIPKDAAKDTPKDEKAAAAAPVTDATPPPAEGLKSKDEAAAADVTKDNKDGPKVDLPSTDAPSADKKWQDASDSDLENSDIKKEMYQDLTKRRQEMEDKEKKLSEREALLEAAQKELDRKVKEMEGLRDELKDLLKQQTAEEAARIQSLVKIYSNMKPKDAARIFNTLDTDILMRVVSSMPEAKVSPIIALMDADRAKALTTLLAEQKKLPDVP